MAEPLDVLDEGVPDPLGPSGGAAAYDREAFLRLGGFDERIFAYFEDVDLALRLRKAGWSCRLAPAARGTHAPRDHPGRRLAPEELPDGVRPRLSAAQVGRGEPAPRARRGRAGGDRLLWDRR